MKDAFYTNEYSLPSIIRENVRIDWVNLNEGYDGDYDPENPEDKNLLRFDVFHHDGKDWYGIEDGSYCTQVHAGATKEKLVEHLKQFMDIVYDDVSKHGKAKRLCEQLSWTS